MGLSVAKRKSARRMTCHGMLESESSSDGGLDGVNEETDDGERGRDGTEVEETVE